MLPGRRLVGIRGVRGGSVTGPEHRAGEDGDHDDRHQDETGDRSLVATELAPHVGAEGTVLLVARGGRRLDVETLLCCRHGSLPQSYLIRGSRRPYVTSDRKSTRLNSSHVRISYAVFCLKKK